MAHWVAFPRYPDGIFVARSLGAYGGNIKRRTIAILGTLSSINAAAWIWAIIVFQNKPILLGVALVVYGLGLRHAIDADHIAAIDNVTRKLMQANQRPVTIGLYFALGHSSIVIFVTAAVAGLATALDSFQRIRDIGGAISTSVSAFFLIAVAVMNTVIFRSIYRSYRQVRMGSVYVEEDLDILLRSPGIFTRCLRPLFQMVTRSWHMFPLGFLFGLGFDTATEVAMFGVSATQAAQGVPFTSVLIFPFLFAAGMSLLDTLDGVVMLGAYDWAFVNPIRKLYYNMTITLISIAVATLIGGVEALSLISAKYSLNGPFWSAIDVLAGNMNLLGFLSIGLFVASWLVSYLIFKIRNIDASVLSSSA